MEQFTQYEERSRRLKDKLYLGLVGWCRREGKSVEQFADAMTLATGKEVTKRMIDHWISRDESGRQIPALMASYWRQITRSLPDREHDNALGEIEAVEYREGRS